MSFPEPNKQAYFTATKAGTGATIGTDLVIYLGGHAGIATPEDYWHGTIQYVHWISGQVITQGSEAEFLEFGGFRKERLQARHSCY